MTAADAPEMGPQPILNSYGWPTHLETEGFLEGYPVERGIPHPVRYDLLPAVRFPPAAEPNPQAAWPDNDSDEDEDDYPGGAYDAPCDDPSCRVCNPPLD